MKEKLLNVRQAGEILGISHKTLFQWRWKRVHLPFIKVGKALRVSERDLQDFIEKMKTFPSEK